MPRIKFQDHGLGYKQVAFIKITGEKNEEDNYSIKRGLLDVTWDTRTSNKSVECKKVL